MLTVILVTKQVCWWFHMSVTFQSVVKIIIYQNGMLVIDVWCWRLDLSSTSKACNQHIWPQTSVTDIRHRHLSPTSVTDIDHQYRHRHSSPSLSLNRYHFKITLLELFLFRHSFCSFLKILFWKFLINSKFQFEMLMLVNGF